MIKVSDYVAELLEARGIRHVFGIVGAGNAHLFDSIHKRGFTEIVCVHHEQAACMAMQTYYRVSGTITAAILTTGAGSTNASTGVVGAWADSIPGVVISGNEHSRHARPENPLRMWGVQGYDSAEMVRRVTKYATRVSQAADIGYELQKAFHIAGSGRPGPVWVDVPMDIQSSQVDEASIRVFAPETPAIPSLTAAVDRVVAMLRESERPVLWLGHGIRLAGGVPLLERLLEATGAPALVTWAGIDMLPSDHPQVYGRAGVYGGRAANFVLQNCDALLAIGTRLAIPQVGYDLTEFARAAKLAVVDIDPTELAKHGDRVNVAVEADARVFLEALLARLESDPLPPVAAWRARCDALRAEYPPIGPEHADRPGYINSYPVLERMSDHLAPDQVVVTDMGTALLSGHQVMRFRDGQRMLTSTGLGEMGFGLPGAIGASFGRDRGEVLCLNCDGGMMMNLQELQTIVHHSLPIKIIVFNNDGYLMIKHTQKALFAGRYSGTNERSGVTCPDYAKVAHAFGMPAYAIRTWEDFDRVVPEILAHQGPLICEIFMDPEQLFVPKLSLATQPDGSLISPPLEDLSPFIPRDALEAAMLVGMHEKSRRITV